MGSRVAVAPTFEEVLTTTRRTDKPTVAVPAAYGKILPDLNAPGGDGTAKRGLVSE